MVQMHMMIVNYGCGTCRSKPCANSFAPMFFFTASPEVVHASEFDGNTIQTTHVPSPAKYPVAANRSISPISDKPPDTPADDCHLTHP